MAEILEEYDKKPINRIFNLLRDIIVLGIIATWLIQFLKDHFSH